ncbi:MAG TPA: methenyltetrahydrofolate cyclohydrolase, partial [Thermoplasmatales archaeon]|nr:methenyltetrahydrofolate cyclohydrolase [Thermoplasmatales archaeon]HEX16838.1 methenyltetrahydrofolate cyclohydrolase [Thermoplasmatales archaeon]
MKLVDMRLRDFVDELSSDSPAPGGGSVAALAGALSSALSSMVCNLTIGKEKYKDVEHDMERILDRVEDMKRRFMDLIDRDTEAFNKVMEALKLPKETDEEKRIRKEKIQDALKGAALVPLETARMCAEMIELCKEVAEKGNKNSITDVGVAAIMAKAGLESAILNVKIN